MLSALRQGYKLYHINYIIQYQYQYIDLYPCFDPLIMNLDNQWWFGRNLTNGNGQMGLFPSNFIFIPRDIRQKFNITVKTAD